MLRASRSIWRIGTAIAGAASPAVANSPDSCGCPATGVRESIRVRGLCLQSLFSAAVLRQGGGLHYNYFRDYDPAMGQYLQADPIGLAGGIKTYGYVGGNPIPCSDPLGCCRRMSGGKSKIAFEIRCAEGLA